MPNCKAKNIKTGMLWMFTSAAAFICPLIKWEKPLDKPQEAHASPVARVYTQGMGCLPGSGGKIPA